MQNKHSLISTQTNHLVQPLIQVLFISDNVSALASLKQVKLPIVDKSTCEKGLGSTYSLDPSNICAGGKKDEDTCSGDGGGPLFCKRKDTGDKEKYVQVSGRVGQGKA